VVETGLFASPLTPERSVGDDIIGSRGRAFDLNQLIR
jgi:hypothetical protein